MPRHVFVETNFIVELVRPFPAAEAERLLARSRSGEFDLHVPWVSIPESKRTLLRIINEDLGFDTPMRKLAVREFRDGQLSVTDKAVVDAMANRVKSRRAKALSQIEQAVDDAVAQMTVIQPSKAVVAKTLSLYPTKSLPPFDEMVLGAVLAEAESLLATGENQFYFCNLNKKDFHTPSLLPEYQRLTIVYLPSFDVPT